MPKKLAVILVSALALYSVACTIGIIVTGCQSRRTGEQLERLADQLADSTETNRELKNRLAVCSDTVDGLAETTSRGVRTVEDCIRLLGEIRKEVKILEDCLSDINTSYSALDVPCDGGGGE